MNKVILVGRLTKDPELRSTSGGISATNFSIAVNRNYKNKEGNYDADFINCVSFRNTADFISKFFKKGSLIGIEGRIQTRNYDAQDGSKRYVTEVMVDNAEFVGGKNDNQGGSFKSNSPYIDESSSAPIDNASTPEIDIPSSDPYENYDNEVSLSDNDLPF